MVVSPHAGEAFSERRLRPKRSLSPGRPVETARGTIFASVARQVRVEFVSIVKSDGHCVAEVIVPVAGIRTEHEIPHRGIVGGIAPQLREHLVTGLGGSLRSEPEQEYVLDHEAIFPSATQGHLLSSNVATVPRECRHDPSHCHRNAKRLALWLHTMRLMALPGGIGYMGDDGSVAELDVPHHSLHAFLADGGSLQSLATAPVRRRIEGRDAVSAQSVTWGGAVWGIGMNYTSKQHATGASAP